MRSLVVDDSASMRRLLCSLLQERGHECTTVGTAEAGLAAHLEQPFDIMLVDWTLPGMSGLDLCRQVRELPGGEDVVILLVTGRSRVEDLRAVLDAGASDYVAKPLEADVLRTRLMVAESRAREQRRRRTLETAMRQSEESFRNLIESSPDGILVHRAGKLLYANPRLISYLAHSDTEALVGQSPDALIHPEDRELFHQRHRTYAERGVAAPPTELRLLRRDGSVVTAEGVSMPIMYKGERCTLKTLRDITDRKQMQARLVMADRMASVGTLAAGVAHELNNPLAYVTNNLALLQEALRAANDPELSSLVDEAIHGADRMRHIIRDLKTFSKGDDELSDHADVLEVLASSINMCRNELKHRARLVRDLGQTPAVRVNESRLGQVFVALLVNAAQALEQREEPGAEVRVRTGTDAAGWAYVIVEDNGPGIAPDVMGRIFDPFFTTKPQDVGTGLGLSICHNIVTSAGGRLEVESSEEGARFTVSLPPAKDLPSKRPASRRMRAVAAESAARVLVVDDEPLVGRSIRRALKGHDVRVVSGGADALEALRNGHYDVIFCDLMMPEVSGMEVFERTVARDPALSERFVFMTGGAFTPQARRFLEETVNEALAKPFDLRVVRDIVRQRSPQA